MEKSMLVALGAIVISVIAIVTSVAFRPSTLPIEAGAVGTNELAKDSVTSEKIKDNEITSEDIKDGTITDADISEEGISRIADNAVTTEKIADRAITSDKIADGAITWDMIVEKPLKVVAAGIINPDGTVREGYNIESVEWDDSLDRFRISLSVPFRFDHYITFAAPLGSSMRIARVSSIGGRDMLVYIYDLSSGVQVKASFQFVVFDIA